MKDEEKKLDANETEKEPVKEAESKEKKKKKDKEKSEVETLRQQIADKDDKFLRLAAEYDNFRKRSAKEKSDAYSNAQTDTVKELLPIIDNFERAAENKNASLEDYQKGIDLIFSQFISALDKIGVKAFGEAGDEFDPNIHSAVMTVEDENLGENVIAQVFSKGYKLGEKVIRPAVVQVANT